MTTIPKNILDLNTFEGFYSLYISMTRYYDTYKMAYEATEDEYEKHYGQRKYSSLYSFRSAMSQHFKKKSINT